MLWRRNQHPVDHASRGWCVRNAPRGAFIRASADGFEDLIPSAWKTASKRRSSSGSGRESVVELCAAFTYVGREGRAPGCRSRGGMVVREDVQLREACSCEDTLGLAYLTQSTSKKIRPSRCPRPAISGCAPGVVARARQRDAFRCAIRPDVVALTGARDGAFVGILVHRTGFSLASIGIRVASSRVAVVPVPRKPAADAGHPCVAGDQAAGSSLGRSRASRGDQCAVGPGRAGALTLRAAPPTSDASPVPRHPSPRPRRASIVSQPNTASIAR